MKPAPDNKYKKLVREVQEEFAKRFIHEGLEIADVVRTCGKNPGCSLCYQTVQRFLQFGYAGRIRGYSRGPYATTVFAIADALGMEMQARPKAGQGARKSQSKLRIVA